MARCWYLTLQKQLNLFFFYSHWAVTDKFSVASHKVTLKPGKKGDTKVSHLIAAGQLNANVFIVIFHFGLRCTHDTVNGLDGGPIHSHVKLCDSALITGSCPAVDYLHKCLGPCQRLNERQDTLQGWVIGCWLLSTKPSRLYKASQMVSIHAAPYPVNLPWPGRLYRPICLSHPFSLSTDAGINREPRGRFERLMNL